MTNHTIIKGLLQCHSLLTSIRNNPCDAFAAINAQETLSNAIRLTGEFNTGADPGKFFALKRVTIIKLYVILKSVPVNKLLEPAGDGHASVPLDEIIDRIGLFLCVATDNGEFPAISSPPVYHPGAPAPSGTPDALSPAGPLI